MSLADFKQLLRKIAAFSSEERSSRKCILRIACFTEQLLLAAFDLGKLNIQFSAVEKCEIGELILNALDNIEAGIEESFNELDSEKLVLAQRLLSGLQFFSVLLDDSCSLVSDKYLYQKLTSLAELEIVKEVTNSIDCWSSSPFDPFTFRD